MYPHLSHLQLGQGFIWGQDLTQKWVEMYNMLSGPSKARTPEAIGAGDRLGVPCQLLRTSIVWGKRKDTKRDNIFAAWELKPSLPSKTHLPASAPAKALQALASIPIVVVDLGGCLSATLEEAYKQQTQEKAAPRKTKGNQVQTGISHFSQALWFGTCD